MGSGWSDASDLSIDSSGVVTASLSFEADEANVDAGGLVQQETSIV